MIRYMHVDASFCFPREKIDGHLLFTRDVFHEYKPYIKSLLLGKKTFKLLNTTCQQEWLFSIAQNWIDGMPFYLKICPDNHDWKYSKVTLWLSLVQYSFILINATSDWIYSTFYKAITVSIFHQKIKSFSRPSMVSYVQIFPLVIETTMIL